MLKDPNDNSLSPYELLALSPQASCPEVQKALPRFMRDRKNLPRLGQAQDAVRKLQNAKSRAGIDIWHYHLDVSQLVDDGTSPGQPDLTGFDRVPVAPLESLYCDLQPEAMMTGFRELHVDPVRFTEISAFDGIEGISLQPPFDV